MNETRLVGMCQSSFREGASVPAVTRMAEGNHVKLLCTSFLLWPLGFSACHTGREVEGHALIVTAEHEGDCTLGGPCLLLELSIDALNL